MATNGNNHHTDCICWVCYGNGSISPASPSLADPSGDDQAAPTSFFSSEIQPDGSFDSLHDSSNCQYQHLGSDTITHGLYHGYNVNSTNVDYRITNEGLGEDPVQTSVVSQAQRDNQNHLSSAVPYGHSSLPHGFGYPQPGGNSDFPASFTSNSITRHQSRDFDGNAANTHHSHFASSGQPDSQGLLPDVFEYIDFSGSQPNHHQHPASTVASGAP